MRKIKVFAALCALVVVMCACTHSTSLSLTYNIDNGERVDVTLDATDSDLKLQDKGSGAFAVVLNGSDILTGMWITPEGYDLYVEAAMSDPEVGTVRQYDVGDNTITRYTYPNGQAGPECNFVVKINGMNTAVLLSSLQASEVVDEAFGRLTFKPAEVE